MNPIMKKTLLASSVALAFGAANTEAALVTNLLGPDPWSTDSANFTMLAADGGVVGGTNDVSMQWDGSAYNASSDYTGPGSASNVTMSSTAPFFGHQWTAHDIQLFLPGSYSFDVTLGGGNPETGTLNVTVGADQLGLHMLFDWGGSLNIDVFVVANQGSMFGSGVRYSAQPKCAAGFTGTIVKNCLYDGPFYGSAGQPTKAQVWMLASADGNGDGVMGIPMASGGPFAGFSDNFNATLNPVPIPAAIWLFGPGLMGLAGIAHRKTNAKPG
jgi:hypothetical protein